MREEVPGLANMSPKKQEDKPRTSLSEQLLAKHPYDHVLIPAIIITEGEWPVNAMGLWVWSLLPTNTQETVHSQAGSSTVFSLHCLENFMGLFCQHHSFQVKNTPPHTYPPNSIST